MIIINIDGIEISDNTMVCSHDIKIRSRNMTYYVENMKELIDLRKAIKVFLNAKYGSIKDE